MTQSKVSLGCHYWPVQQCSPLVFARPLGFCRATAAAWLIALCSVAGWSAATVGASERVPAAELVAADRVLVIGHRGASGCAPENTLPAFERAMAAGADLVELDYFHSADGVPVVLHDYTLDRTTNAEEVLGQPKLKVTERSLADLAKLDAGSWFHADFAGTRLPTLSESLDLIQAGSTTLIERKGGDAATCVKLLRQKGLLDQVVVQSFDWDYVTDCHREHPALVLAALGRGPLGDKQLDKVAQTGARIVGWRHNDVTPEAISLVHARGYQAWVYTVNDLARAKELVEAGIDGIITDIPARVLAFLHTDLTVEPSPPPPMGSGSH